jgi:hypothetical protein
MEGRPCAGRGAAAGVTKGAAGEMRVDAPTSGALLVEAGCGSSAAGGGASSMLEAAGACAAVADFCSSLVDTYNSI